MIWLVLLLAISATPAAADPVSALIIGALGGSAAIGVVGVALVRIGVGIAASQLASILFKPKSVSGVGDPGIRTQATTAGGINSQSIILGRYRTAGNLSAPRMSHGEVDDTPNAYRTHVYDISDMPITALHAVLIDDEKIDLSDMTASSTVYGLTPDGGIYKDYFWIDVNNGRAGPNTMLTDKYGTRTERPWESDMIGRGLAYIVATFLYNRELYQADPAISFIVDGLKLYDPRRDSSIGGIGTHRYGFPGTYEFTLNPVLMVYNILRGIRVSDDLVYGLNVAAADLPLDVWAAAISKAGTSDYKAGYEIRFADDEPLDIIDELLKTCDADLADVGGTWLVRVGGPGLPIAFITDEHILRTKPQDLDPFPSLNETYNGINVTFISPEVNWQPTDAPPRYDLAAELKDGRRLVADLALPAVTNMTQAQKLSRAWLLDARRMRRHNITLGPEGLLINPLDTISWSSTRNGYLTKWFEVNQRAIDPVGLCCTLSLRERDPADYDWQPDFEIPTSAPSSNIVVPVAQVLPNFDVNPFTINDDLGARRPALLMTWTGQLRDVRAIRWVIRVKSSQRVVAQGSTHDVAANGLTVSSGILPNVTYEARARMVVDRANKWTDWRTAVSPDVRLGTKDIGPGSISIAQLAAEAWAEVMAIDAKADAIQEEVTENLQAAQAEFASLQTDLDAAQYNLGISITGLQTRVTDTEAGIVSEATSRQAADLSLSNRVDVAVSRVGTSEAAIASETATRASADLAIAGTVTAVTARVGTAEAAITAEQTARANADSAIIGTANALAARVGTAEGAISSEATARANADSAISGTINSVEASLKAADTAIKASVTAEALARTNADSSLASSINTVNARVGSAEAETQTLQTAYATTDGKVRAMVGIRASTTGSGGGQKISSIRLTSYQDPDGTSGSAIQMDADNVLVQRTLSANRLIAKTITAASGAIGDFAVDTLQIAGEAVTVANFGSRNAAITVNDSGWTDICSVNLNCDDDYDVFVIVAASTAALSYRGIATVAGLEYRVTHQGNSFGSFSENKEVEFIRGDNAADDLRRISASDDSMPFMKVNPGNGVKTFKLQAANNGNRDRIVTSGLIRAQMVKR